MGKIKGRGDSRKRWLAKYGSLYVEFKPPGYWRPDCCAYCGNLYQAYDHVPPLSWVAALGPSYFDKNGLLIVKVRSCNECNSLLSNKKLFSLRERTVYLIGRYEERYKKYRTGTAWQDEEVNELTGNLKKAINNFADMQRAIDRRIQILEENAAVR